MIIDDIPLEPNGKMGVMPGAVAQSFARPWNSDPANIKMMIELIRRTRPRFLIETGTFEALTTMFIAECVQTYASAEKPAYFYTFDAGIPIDFDNKPVQRWTTNPDWSFWGTITVTRQKRLAKDYGHCHVRYVEGLTQETLPKMVGEIGPWDFWFQDSEHALDGILAEWKILREYAHPFSVVIFDDMAKDRNGDDHPFVDWFLKNEPGWATRWIDTGRKQLWAEMIQ